MSLVNNYQLDHKINQGVNFIGNGRSIDVILRRIEGTRGKRRAYLEISWDINRDVFYLKDINQVLTIVDGIRIRLRKVRNGKNLIGFIYEVPRGYEILRKDYSNGS
jgi:hypothetical protein